MLTHIFYRICNLANSLAGSLLVYVAHLVFKYKKINLHGAGLIQVFFLLGQVSCSSLFSVDALHIKTYHIPLRENSIPLPATEVSSKYSLLVKDARGNELISSRKIVFSKNVHEQGWYQYANWDEPPTKRFTSLLVQALSASEGFSSVSFAASSAFADYELNTEIVEFYHDVRDRQPGVARIRVLAEVLETRNRKVVANKIFTFDSGVETFDAQGAVLASSDVLNRTVGEIGSWLLSLRLGVARR